MERRNFIKTASVAAAGMVPLASVVGKEVASPALPPRPGPKQVKFGDFPWPNRYAMTDVDSKFGRLEWLEDRFFRLAKSWPREFAVFPGERILCARQGISSDFALWVEFVTKWEEEGVIARRHIKVDRMRRFNARNGYVVTSSSPYYSLPRCEWCKRAYLGSWSDMFGSIVIAVCPTCADKIVKEEPSIGRGVMEWSHDKYIYTIPDMMVPEPRAKMFDRDEWFDSK